MKMDVLGMNGLVEKQLNIDVLNVYNLLMKIGCSWDEETCYQAAKNRTFWLFKYAHENGCSWNDETWVNCSW